MEQNDRLTIKFLEGKLFGLPDEAEDQAPSNEIQPGIETDWELELDLSACGRLAGLLNSHAPVGVNVCSRSGKVKLRIPARLCVNP